MLLDFLPLIVVGVVAFILVIATVSMYNNFVRLRNRIEEAFSTMDVYMKKRFDLVPNLVETVKGYAAHERGTLDEVTSARSMIQSATTPEQRMQGESTLTNTLRSLFAVAENYPDLKANVNFIDLQNQLSQIEDEIAQSRKYYNAIVREFNTATETFPSVTIAKLFNFERQLMFEVEDEAERQTPQVQF
ncbi:MAG: LemA family protein [Clostridiales Family XIII bacterium]|jgi:LemA protein|nr:LemA family protein [Clostridiales Family XIII bacterium]